jgi:glycosyltransferase involved in cell wall biosynthesis
MLFYSDWPLGYHNQEAERKARAFADRYDVVYVTGVGTRNPRLQSMPKLVDRGMRALRPARAAEAAGALPPGLRAASVLVTPPRQFRPVRALNAAWIHGRLRRAMGERPIAVAWIRHATPELVDALERLGPEAVVYEIVDAHHETPGMVGRWRAIFEDAERRLVNRADVVVVTSPSLAPRFAAWGADVRYVPHGVELFPWRPPRQRRQGDPAVLGFAGTLDRRLDVPLLRGIAQARPEWRIRLVGPIEGGFDRRSLADLPNVELAPPVPHARVADVLAGFDVGLMPYADTPVYRHMSPLKNLELLAAGRPAVARPTPALLPYADLVRFARTSQEFVGQVEDALSEDGPDAALRRRRVAEAQSWDRRISDLHALLDEVLSGHSTRRAPGV